MGLCALSCGDEAHDPSAAGDTPCLVLAVGARDRRQARIGGRTPSTKAPAVTVQASSTKTTDPKEAYARFPAGQLTRYREGWLPE